MILSFFFAIILTMKDVRISIHLTEEEHKAFKKLTKEKYHTSINKFLSDYIRLNLQREGVELNGGDDPANDGIKAISLFANIGIAEAYFKEIGVSVVAANELIKKRADLYSKIYPETKMICGDILQDSIFNEIMDIGKKEKIDIILATPPCQGMSTVGKQDKADIRNTLILPVLDAIDVLLPKYVFIENVPMILQTRIVYEGQEKLIIDVISDRVSENYNISVNKIDVKNYSVPQSRERAIILLSRKDVPLWEMPEKDKKILTMRDAIGDLPSIDPFVKDVSEKELLEMFPDFYKKEKAALAISPWNFPPKHIKRQVEIMIHTPSGKSAFDNEKYFPVKDDGTPVRGFRNTYKRQDWDIPAYTVTMDNRKISSQNNVHPGRYLGIDSNGDVLYSDPRALTIYELMKIMSIPDNWPLPPKTEPAFLRSIIGEGIPSLFTKKVFLNNPLLKKKGKRT